MTGSFFEYFRNFGDFPVLHSDVCQMYRACLFCNFLWLSLTQIMVEVLLGIIIYWLKEEISMSDCPDLKPISANYLLYDLGQVI